jgi:hypothetical protein
VWCEWRDPRGRCRIAQDNRHAFDRQPPLAYSSTAHPHLCQINHRYRSGWRIEPSVFVPLADPDDNRANSGRYFGMEDLLLRTPRNPQTI